MNQLNKLINLLNKINETSSRYEAEFDICKKNVRTKVIRNDDGVNVLTFYLERNDPDFTIELNASIAYLEALICESSESKEAA